MTPNSSLRVASTGIVPPGEYERSESTLAIETIRSAVHTAGVDLPDVDGVYMSTTRPWADQQFFSTFLIRRLGLDVARNQELYTGGTSPANALLSAAADIRAENIDTALLVGVEKHSGHDTENFYDYLLRLFDSEFQSRAGPTAVGIYAQSLRRYLHEYEDVPREAIAEIAVKNTASGTTNPDALSDRRVTIDEVLSSRIIADPLHLYECAPPCDGAVAILLTSKDVTTNESSTTVEIDGIGYHHAPSHFLGPAPHPLTQFPAVRKAANRAFSEATCEIDAIDLIELAAPFPHIEAMYLEELGLFPRGQGAIASQGGETRPTGSIPVSPSGGCIGRGHPAMVTGFLNYVEAVKQLTETAANQVPEARTALCASAHGHGGDGACITIFTGQ